MQILHLENIDLLLKVKRKLKSPRKKRKKILGKSIEERPVAVETREEFGHWEGDGIVDKNRQGQLISLVERKIGIGLLFNVGNREERRIIEVLDDLEVYYAHPYSSFERGTNENWNGIVRRFIPKGKNFDSLDDSTIQRINHYINTLPRKRFGYKTPLDL